MEKNEAIISPIYINNNTMFSEMNVQEYHDVINDINEYSLTMRDKLDLKEDISYQIKIDCEEVTSREKLANALKPYLGKNYDNWKSNYMKNILFDINSSHMKQENWRLIRNPLIPNGIEIDSPTLKNTEENFHTIKQICEITEQFATIGNHCSAEVLVDKKIIGNDVTAWLRFLELWSTYEHIIYRFCYGEYLTERKTLTSVAYPFSKEANQLLKKNDFKSVREFFENLPYFKYWGVYMKESNMVHFQAPNGTLNPIVWQNNLNLFVRMLQCVKQENWNEELVEKRKEINMEGFSIKDYRTIYPMQAFEFADIVFPNNLEKVYFLKQYLKSFEIGDTYLEKAKQFTR